MGSVSLESNDSNGEFMFYRTREAANTLWHLGYHDFRGYESETTIGRYLGRMQRVVSLHQFSLPFKKGRRASERHFDLSSNFKDILGNEDNKPVWTNKQ